MNIAQGDGEFKILMSGRVRLENACLLTSAEFTFTTTIPLLYHINLILKDIIVCILNKFVFAPVNIAAKTYLSMNNIVCLNYI